MNTTAARFGVAAAAVVLVAILGFMYLPGLNVGAEPTPTPTAVPQPTATPIPLGFTTRGDLSPGTYQATRSFAFPVTLTVPAGWTVWNVTTSTVALFKPNPDTSESWLIFDVVSNVYPDPCRTEDGPKSPPVGPGVDDLVNALTSLVGFQAGPVTDVIIGGIAGKAFDLDNSIDTLSASCPPEFLSIWDSAGPGDGLHLNGTAPHARIWIGDVHGTRLAIFVNALEEPVQRDDRQEIQQMLDSVSFE